MTEPELMTQAKFGDLIESITKEKRISYMEAALLICEKRGLDVETIPELLNPKLKKKIQNEALDLNMLKRKKKKHD